MELVREEARETHRKALEAMFEEREIEARLLFQENMRIYPGCYTRNNLACFLLEKARYSPKRDIVEASELLRQSLQSNPNDYHTLSMAGYAAWQLNRISEAHEMYTLATQLRQTSESLYFLALLAFRLKKYAQAADCFVRLEPYIVAMKAFLQKARPLKNVTEAELNHEATHSLFPPPLGVMNIYSLWVSCLVWANRMPEAREVANRSILLESYCNPDRERALFFFETGSLTAYTLLEEYEVLRRMFKLHNEIEGRVRNVFCYDAQEKSRCAHTILTKQPYFLLKHLFKHGLLSDKILLKAWRKQLWTPPPRRSYRRSRFAKRVCMLRFSTKKLYNYYRWVLRCFYQVYVQKQLLEMPFWDVGVPDLGEVHYTDYPEPTDDLCKFIQEMDQGMHISSFAGKTSSLQ